MIHGLLEAANSINYLESYSKTADLLHLKLKQIDDIKIVEDIANEILYKRVSKILRRRDIKKVWLLFDETHNSVYSKELAKKNFVSGYKKDKGATGSILFLTASLNIELNNTAINLVFATHLCRFNCFDKKKFIIDTILKAKELIKKEFVVLADKGFESYEIIYALQQCNVKYIIPKRKNKSIKALIETSIGMHKLLGYVKQGFQKKYFTEYVAVVKSNRGQNDFKKKKNKTNYDDYYVYSTNIFNLNVLNKYYRKRWNIETTFREIKDTAWLKTKSKNPIIRMFYFALNVIIYNTLTIIKFCGSFKSKSEVFREIINTIYFLKIASSLDTILNTPKLRSNINILLDA